MISSFFHSISMLFLAIAYFVWRLPYFVLTCKNWDEKFGEWHIRKFDEEANDWEFQTEEFPTLPKNTVISENTQCIVKTPRFILDERSGIIVIYDTDHPKYQVTPGCHPDDGGVVTHYSGEPVKRENGTIKYWKMPETKRIHARMMLKKLNHEFK